MKCRYCGLPEADGAECARCRTRMLDLFGEAPVPRTAPFREPPAPAPPRETEPEPTWLRDPDQRREPLVLSEKIALGLVMVLGPLMLFVMLSLRFVSVRAVAGIGFAIAAAAGHLLRARRK